MDGTNSLQLDEITVICPYCGALNALSVDATKWSGTMLRNCEQEENMVSLGCNRRFILDWKLSRTVSATRCSYSPSIEKIEREET